jgi:ADP-ribosylglycohydrolase
MEKSNSAINRRSFLKGIALAGVAAPGAVRAGNVAEGKPSTPMAGVGLREKFFGCIAGCHIGSSMGAAVEGSSWQTIEERYGTLDKLLPYHHYRATSKWVREPGTTEDGVERQKLMIMAIIEKKDRVNAEDVRRIWLRDIKPESAGNVSEPFEADLLAMAKAPIPASDLGKYCDYSGLVSMARSCHPVGLINAGDVQGAIDDVYEVGQLYNTANSRGIQWATVTAVAIAAATKPGATVDSVLGAVFDNCDATDRLSRKEAGVVREIDRALKASASCKDFREMRKTFDTIYTGSGMPYAFSYANEVVSKAVCVFRMVKGDPMEAMIAAVNMGRDTDCLASISAGVSGALSGGGSIRQDLIEQVDRATALNVYTNSRRTLRETSDGLYEAFKARLRKMKAYLEEMDLA